MKYVLLALGAASVLSAVPATARHYSHDAVCTKHENGRCVAWRDMSKREAEHAAYRVGHDFGANYAYTDFSALPQRLVTRYHLRDEFRYVHSNGHVYVVNPRTYRVVRVVPG